MSPGKWPNPSLANSGQAKPRTTSAVPRMMRKRAMDASEVRLIVARVARRGWRAVCSCANSLAMPALLHSLRGLARMADTVIDATGRVFSWLVVFVVIALFAQWPLRELV